MREPEQRALIANENATNAERFLRAIRQHAESNKVFRAVFSNRIPKDTRRVRWNDSELDFMRQGHYPEPSIDTIGMSGAMTSRHYTHMTFDDPISEEAVKSDKVMNDTISRIHKLLSLFVKPEKDTFWLVGTRWSLNDVYADFQAKYADRLARFVRSAIEDGEPIFPELLSLDTLALIRKNYGEYMFSCLYMNNPRNEEVQTFNVDDLRWCRVSADDVWLIDPDGTETPYKISALDITTTVDLAPAEAVNSDRNAVVTVGVTPTGRAVVLDAWAKRCTPLELIEKIFQVKTRFNPRAVGIEDVAYQKAFKYFVRQEMERRGTWMNIVPIKATGKKGTRIQGLQPIAATGRLYLDPTQHLLRQEMADFPLGKHDDVVDCLAMHLQLWRGVLSPSRMEDSRRIQDDIIRRIDGYGWAHDSGDPEYQDAAEREQVEWEEVQLSW